MCFVLVILVTKLEMTCFVFQLWKKITPIKPLVYTLSASVTIWLIYCLQSSVFLEEIRGLNVYISFLLKANTTVPFYQLTVT